MNILTTAGSDPWQALHSWVDNQEVIWKKNDMKVIIHDVKLDFMSRRGGEFILYRLSHQCNVTTEALIYLYTHYKDQVDLNALKVRGRTILCNLVSRSLDITPKQIETLVNVVGLDITAKDSRNRSVLHFASNALLTAPKLKTITKLLWKRQKDQFTIDLPDRQGTTPFQQWLHVVRTKVWQYMDVVEAWEYLGSDITQLDNESSLTVLHYYLRSSVWNMELAYIRKMCFDTENPWKSFKKDDTKGKGRKAGKYKMPMHVRPIPNNETLAELYLRMAVKNNERINIEVLRYFESKKDIRFDLDSPLLWWYLKSSEVDMQVVKFLIEELKFSIQPQPKDNVILHYMTYQGKRDQIHWDVLDYFYNYKNSVVDFKGTQGDYITILHLYAKYSRSFDCGDFKRLIERYDLDDIPKTVSTKPTPAGAFYKDRPECIRPDIIECFTSLGYDIHEPVDNMTPIHYYCQMTGTSTGSKTQNNINHYIISFIVESFIKHGADIHNSVCDKQFASVCQTIANAKLPEDYRYDQLKTLQMMRDHDTFGVQLIPSNKRKQGIWYNFLDFHVNWIEDTSHAYNLFFDRFAALIRIYIDAKKEPKHLLYDDKTDANKKIKYKIYLVKDTGSEAEDELNFVKNRKNLIKARKYFGRYVFVTDIRDSVFRSCMVMDPRSEEDLFSQIPQMWLTPVNWSDFMTRIDSLTRSYRNFKKSVALAESNVFIDSDLIEKISALHVGPEMTKNGYIDSMNDVLLRNDENILLKYLRCNHESQILAVDINQLADLNIDFKYGYDSCSHALANYCKHSDGAIDDSIVKALCRGGCPIDWDCEDNDDEKGKGVVVKTSFTPLQLYAKLPECNVNSFKTLVQCGADVTIESENNRTAVYYALVNSKNVTPAFIEYLSKECEYKFNEPLTVTRDEDTILFNVYLRQNKHITKEATIALVNSGNCDPNSRDDAYDTNSIKAYFENPNIKRFSMDIIRVLVHLGANINEPDNEGVYPIQHLLLINHTPVQKIMHYIGIMLELGAKLEHILWDDETVIEDHRLYILRDLEDGNEHFDNLWCTIRSASGSMKWALALREFEQSERVWAEIRRNNLINITKQQLFDKYPNIKDAMTIDGDQQDVFSAEHHQDDCKVEEEEQKEHDDNDKYKDPISREINTSVAT